MPGTAAKRPCVRTSAHDLACHGKTFQGARKLNIKSVRAILIRCDRKDERAFAFDDLQAAR